MVKKILCFSGGKDSTAMLIHLLKTNSQIDEILYIDVGDWMWDIATEHISKIKETFDVDITVLNVVGELEKGFKRWGFPSFINRWCTGVKRIAMRDYLRENYGDEQIIQYIGYCYDERERAKKDLYSAGDVEYPLIDAGITTEDALNLCKEYGFDFGGVYEHHEHFNCWLCPLQRKSELYEVFKRYPHLWERLHSMQWETDGYYYPNQSIFDIEKQFWNKQRDELKKERMKSREKYNMGVRKRKKK